MKYILLLILPFVITKNSFGHNISEVSNLNGNYDGVIYEGLIQKGFSYKLSSATQFSGLGLVYIQTESYQEVKKIILEN